VGGRAAHRAHLVEGDRYPPFGQGPGGFTSRQTPADHTRRQPATSAVAASSTIISCPHFRHLRETPIVLVRFSSMPR